MVKVVEEVSAPKRKRFNKNKKKAWRKKTDISKVEEHLEEERREERSGGPLQEKEDTDLMFLDVGEGDTSKASGKNEVTTLTYTVDVIPQDSGKKKVKKATLKPSKRDRTVKVLKCHQFIHGLPGAKTPHKFSPKQDMLVAMKKIAQLRAKDPKIIKKAKTTVGDVKTYKKKHSKGRNLVRNTFNTDLWGEDNDRVIQECKDKGVEDSFAKGISSYYKTTRKLKSVKVPRARYVPPSTLDSVQAPAPGQSYNPTYEDHQDLLQRAKRQEDRKIRSKKRIEAMTTKCYPTADEAPTEETWIAEMSEGLPRAEEELSREEENEDEGESQNVTVTKKRKIERKTRQKRRKEKKDKLRKIMKLENKEDRIRSSDVFRIKTLQKELDEEEELTRMRKMSRRLHKERAKSRPRQLGKLSYTPEAIPLKLGNELPDCLRRATPAIGLLDERFKNFQRRNLIEPRLPHKVKLKYKPKKQMKRGHREALAEIEKWTEEAK